MHVVIVGSGLLGLCTAYFLRRHGFHVTVVDRRQGPGLEASFANGGMLIPSMPDPWNAPGVAGELLRSFGRQDAPLLLRTAALPSLFTWGIRFLRNSSRARFDRNTLKNMRLALYSLSITAEVRKATGISYHESACGTLRTFRENGALDQAAERAEWLRAHGLSSRALDVRQTIALEPALSDIARHLVGSIYYPGDETGDARLFCDGLAAAVESAGGRLLFGTEVLGWHKEGSRIQAVLTTAGSLAGDLFVLAAGSHSDALARKLGLPLAVRPAKGYSVTVPTSAQGPRLPVVDDGLHAAVAPLGATLRIAGTAEFAGFDVTVSAPRIACLLQLLQDIYPSLYSRIDRSAVTSWAGLRPMSADGVPILGKTPVPNLYLNTGHGHLGWSMAAGSGCAVADLIAGAPPQIDLQDYALSRF